MIFSPGLSSRWTTLLSVSVISLALITPGASVKHENFKTCSQSGFCTRNRALADSALTQSATWSSPYELDASSLSFENGQLQGIILKSLGPDQPAARLPATVSFLVSGVARVTIDEERRQTGDIELRHNSNARKERYNEAARWALVGGLELSTTAVLESDVEGVTKVAYGPSNKYEAIIHHAPFSIDFRRDDETHVKINDRGLLNIEHWRPQTEKKEDDNSTESDDTQTKEDESTWWDESFGGNTDSKPRGPESVGLDFTFPGYEHVFGIPEHTGPLSLRETRGGTDNFEEPYRLYNADVFEYEMNSPMTLYGSIPFMHAHKKNSSVGIFWLNAAETWIDIVKVKASTNPLSLGVKSARTTQTHWYSESGILDVFVFLGPTPHDLTKAYGELTGYTQLPQQFAIAHHQCRWNYVTDDDVRSVDHKMDKYHIPYDVIWLDIEYTDGKKYFTWDPQTFPDPLGMQKQLDESERKLVVIIDPHIKVESGYTVVDELKSKSLAVNNKDGNIYEGWCWPGSSHWVDCFNPLAREWWQSLFTYDKFPSGTPNMFIWNDMNEPSVFNGPETSMPRDNLHYGNWEHRDVHNLNGMTLASSTYQALQSRKKGELRRPFVLTRSFFSGSQRFGAMWTGDNQAQWSHLAASIPMILANGIAGFPFAGADVGGFFGNTEKDLLARWYQAGAFYPFFRAHAHIDTRRREPYLIGEPYTSIITQALRLRYQLLPAWYTAFHTASVDGSPIVRPQYYVHPSDERGFAIDDQLYLGSTGLLAKPVVQQDQETQDIYIADDELYYDYFDYTVYAGAGKFHTVPAPLSKVPVLMQGGHIIPRRDRPRRSSGLMRYDPFTLVVVLGKTGDAEGELYLDDGDSYDYMTGAQIHRHFKFSPSSASPSEYILESEDVGMSGEKTEAYLKSMASVTIEKVVVVGAPKEWSAKDEVLIEEDGVESVRKTELSWHEAEAGRAAWAVVRKPNVAIGEGWKIVF